MTNNLRLRRSGWALAGLAATFLWMTAGTRTALAFQGTTAPAAQTEQASQADIDASRGSLDHFLDSHPEIANDVFGDPQRINDPNYIHEHPELQAFLESHPLVKADPRAFVSPQAWRYESHRTDTDNLLGWFIPFGVFICCLLAVLTVLRTVLENRRWNKTFKVHEDVHTKLIEKFSSGQELTAYMESDAGKRLLEWTPPVVETRAPLAASRILWSLQAGLILGLAGIGLLAIRDRIPDGAEALLICGTLGLTIGIGFFCSAFLSYAISKHLGLLNGRTQGESRLATAGR